MIFKLLADGSALDTSFAAAGIFSEPVGTAAEAYGALVQTSGKLVTVGYGRATSANTTSDILSIRLTAGGVLDTSYGTATPVVLGSTSVAWATMVAQSCSATTVRSCSVVAA